MAELFDSLLARSVLRTVVQYLITFWSQLQSVEAVSEAIISIMFVRPFVPDKRVKICYPCLNRSREIRPKAIGGGIYDSCFMITSDRKEIVTSFPVWL